MAELTKPDSKNLAEHALRLLMYKGVSLTAVLGDFSFLVVLTGIMVTLATVAFQRDL